MIEMDEWHKIIDDPGAEVKALAHRMIRWLEAPDQVKDHVKYHFVFMAWRQLSKLGEELALLKYDLHSEHDYAKWMAQGRLSLALGIIRTIREEMDEIDRKGPLIHSHREMIIQPIVDAIRSELVCCDSHGRLEDTWNIVAGTWDEDRYRQIRASPDFHESCNIAESAARIAEAHV